MMHPKYLKDSTSYRKPLQMGGSTSN